MRICFNGIVARVITMAKKRFKSDLSISGIKRLQEDIIKYQNTLPNKARLLTERLAEMGVDIAKVNISRLDAVFTGELIQSIHSVNKSSTRNGAIFCVVADSEHAVFVEFGTGIVGQQSPYPYPLPSGMNWQYASGQTIRQLADGRYGWFYPADNGQWYFTEGMPSRPFMYETALELQKKVVEEAKKIFK